MMLMMIACKAILLALRLIFTIASIRRVMELFGRESGLRKNVYARTPGF